MLSISKIIINSYANLMFWCFEAKSLKIFFDYYACAWACVIKLSINFSMWFLLSKNTEIH